MMMKSSFVDDGIFLITKLQSGPGNYAFLCLFSFCLLCGKNRTIYVYGVHLKDKP